jgi:hypothetical protein
VKKSDSIQMIQFDFEKYKKETIGILTLAVITITLGNAWNTAMIVTIEGFAKTRNNYILWLFIYAVVLTVIAFGIVIYVFPLFGINKSVDVSSTPGEKDELHEDELHEEKKDVIENRSFL